MSWGEQDCHFSEGQSAAGVTSAIIVLMSKKAPGSFRKGLLSVLLALASFSLGMMVEGLQRHEGISGWTLWIDNITAALLLGLVVFFYERRRERELIKKLQVIELMNHHVRNALQPVMYLPYSQDQEMQLNTIREAVQRIDWALREILPGHEVEESAAQEIKV